MLFLNGWILFLSILWSTYRTIIYHPALRDIARQHGSIYIYLRCCILLFFIGVRSHDESPMNAVELSSYQRLSHLIVCQNTVTLKKHPTAPPPPSDRLYTVSQKTSDRALFFPWLCCHTSIIAITSLHHRTHQSSLEILVCPLLCCSQHSTDFSITITKVIDQSIKERESVCVSVCVFDRLWL